MTRMTKKEIKERYTKELVENEWISPITGSRKSMEIYNDFIYRCRMNGFSGIGIQQQLWDDICNNVARHMQVYPQID